MLLTLSKTGSVPPTFSDTNVFSAGTVRTINSLTSSNNTISNVNVTFHTALATNYAHFHALSSISSFQIYSSFELSFNSSIHNLTDIGFVLSTKIFGLSYFKVLKINYIAIKCNSTVWGFKAQFIYYDCFLCDQLIDGNKTRSQIFKNQNTIATITNTKMYEIQSFITGINLKNLKQINKKVTVQTNLQNNQNYLVQNVTVSSNTILQWICIGTIILDKTFNLFLDDIYAHQLGNFTLNLNTKTINLLQFSSYLKQFYSKSSKFFGLSQIQVNYKRIYQIIDFKSQNPKQIQLNYQSMQSGGKMAFMYFSYRLCPTTNLLYSLKQKLCYDACPSDQINLRQTCRICHYSCLTCTGDFQTDCVTCEVTSPPRVLNGTQCPCPDNFIDVGVLQCQPCQNYIQNCLICPTKTFCSQCVDLMIWNSTSQICQCPVGTFFVVADLICVTFPGCLITLNTSGVITCDTCDSANHFISDGAGFCKCDTNYILNVSFCQQICGNGINLVDNSSLTCDDNNTISGDGCSDQCLIQVNYTCFNILPLNISYCSPILVLNIKFIYVERVIYSNKGIFMFSVQPSDIRMQNNTFKFSLQTTIPYYSYQIEYIPSTQFIGFLKVTVDYKQTIENNPHTMKINFDPFVVSVWSQPIQINIQGVNYAITYDYLIQMNNLLIFGFMAISGFIVLFSLAFVILDKKNIALELLLSSQMIYFGVLNSQNNHINLYPFSGMRFLAGYNYLVPLQVNLYNYGAMNLHSSGSNAEFLLNFNFMGILLFLAILFISPFKLKVKFHEWKKQKIDKNLEQKIGESDDKKLKALKSKDNNLKNEGQKVKNAQKLYENYMNMIYFPFSVIVLLPVVIYFSFQLAFMSRVNSFSFDATSNILTSIIFTLLSFFFIVLLYYDMERRDKIFIFSPKLKQYTYYLILVYFAAVCICNMFLLTDFTIWVQLVLILIIIVYIIYSNPYEKKTLDQFDSKFKPISTFISLGLILILDFTQKQMIFIPIIVLVLLTLNLIFSMIRVLKIKYNQLKKMIDINMKIKMNNMSNVNYNFDGDQDGQMYLQNKYKNNQYKNQGQILNKKGNINNQINDFSFNDKNIENFSPQQRLKLLQKQNENEKNENQSNLSQDKETEQEDILKKIKRNLRDDLKKKRGIVTKTGQGPHQQKA